MTEQTASPDSPEDIEQQLVHRPRWPCGPWAPVSGASNRYTHLRTGCSAAWRARVLWVLLGVLSNPPGAAALTWAFDARGCGNLTVR
jgi:hypothetical protein